MGSFILFWQENFNQDKHFTLKDRVKQSLKRMLKLWGTMAVGGCIFLTILIAGGLLEGSTDAVKTTCILLGNTYGLVVISLLLGYGLAELPMMLWRYSNSEHELEIVQTKAANAFKRMTDASLACSITAASVHKTIAELKKRKHSRDDEMERAFQLTLDDCPDEFIHSKSGGEVHKNKEGKVTLEELAILRRQLCIDKSSYFMSKAKVERIKKESFYLQDILDSRDRDVQKIKWSFGMGESTHKEWLWHVKFKPIFYKLASLVSWIMSFFVWFGLIGVISGYNSGISVFSIVVHTDGASMGGITVFVLLTLGYIAYTTMWSLFQMRIANMMDIVPDQQTTPKSLSFNARQTAKLSAALVFFYLGIIYESGTVTGGWMKDKNDEILKTGFSRFYGTIEVMPFLGDSFNLFFPLVIIILGFFQIFNIFNRVLVYLHLENFQFGEVEVTESQLKEGRRQLERDRKRMDRAAKRDQTRAKIDKLKRGGNVLEMSGNEKQETDDELFQTGNSFDPPRERSGWIEKKSDGMRFTASWKPAYLVLKAPGYANFYENDKVVGSSHSSGGKEEEEEGEDGLIKSVDLRIVVTITNPFSKKKGSISHEKLDFETANGTIHLRFTTGEECEEWRELLLAWQDWAIDFGGGNYPRSQEMGVDDEEKGGNFQSSNNNSNNYFKSNRENEEEEEVQMSLIKNQDESDATKSPMPPGKKLSLSDIIIPGEEDMDFDFSTGLSNTSNNTTKREKNNNNQRNDSLGFDTKPKLLMGYLEKGTSNRFKPWHNRYFEVREEDASLTYWETNDTDGPPRGVIELRLVDSISHVMSKKGVEDRRKVEIVCGSRTYQLRGRDEEVGEHWVTALSSWRDYFLMNPHIGMRQSEINEEDLPDFDV